jgi:thymidylate synthase
MFKADQYYKNSLKQIIENGSLDENPRPKYKDGTPAYSKFITQVFEEYDISNGEYPFTTLRNTAIKTGIKEVLWIYQQQSASLVDARNLGINWWEEWNIGNDTIGQRYGATVAKWDLMNKLLHSLKHDPFSRRHIMNLYQESDLNETKGLNPCAYETIWTVRNSSDKTHKLLDMTLVQRSSDYLMANWINKGQYYALLLMVAADLGYRPGKFCHLVQNLHIYDRHIDAAKELLAREPQATQPLLSLPKQKSFYEFKLEDFQFTGFDSPEKLSSKLEIAI